MLRLNKTTVISLCSLLVTLFFLHLGLERRLDQDNTGVMSSATTAKETETDHEPEKYLTYLPHSGLHNQRIALINSIVLAKALNRTLIMPELNLGTATYWRPTSLLPYRLDECGDEYMHHLHIEHKKLKDGRRKAWWSANCFDYRNYLPMAVDWIFDLEPVHDLGIRTIQRQDMQLDYFERMWSVPMDERNQSLVYQIIDNSRYSYQIIDQVGGEYDNSTTTKFTEQYSLQQLDQQQERFMIFNSLFGSDRLALPSGGSWAKLREKLRRDIGVSQPWVVNQSQIIIDRLGGPSGFISVHIRMGDGIFKTMQDETMALVRQQLIQRQDDNQSTEDETTRTTLTSISSLPFDQRLSACLGLHKNQTFANHQLGLIYMTTDANSPRTTLPHLFEEFVCMFTLNDFNDIVDTTLTRQLALLDHRHFNTTSLPTTNGELLLPLIDAEVASQASFFVPTAGSTFSGYIEHRNKRFQRLYNTNSH